MYDEERAKHSIEPANHGKAQAQTARSPAAVAVFDRYTARVSHGLSHGRGGNAEEL